MNYLLRTMPVNGPMKIFKYPLLSVGAQNLMLPKGAKILSVQFQGEALCVWALVDPDAIPAPVMIWIIGTGDSLPLPSVEMEHLGTVQVGKFVWHIFRQVSL